MNKNKSRYGCSQCGERFNSWQQRNAHEADAHKPPRKTIQQVKRYGEYHSLIGGMNLKIGNTVEFTKTGVITKIITTEGSNDVEIEIAVIKDFYTLQ
jgi:hypothetical protein